MYVILLIQKELILFLRFKGKLDIGLIKLWMFMKIKMAGCGWVQLDMAYYVIILMTSNFLTILLRMVSQIIQLSAQFKMTLGIFG